MPHATAAVEWGRGDLWTLLIAVVIFIIGCLFHRRALRQQGVDCADMLAGMMSSSLSVGPLLMIIVDPLNKWIHFSNIDFFVLVMNESRITLWFACFLALVNTAMGLMRSREAVAVAGPAPAE